ncbi:MAG: hypothetical protein DHS20C21_14210 [Gemmatimonadota bacterium]|nr:MAG: hypothetical protein DHS20C21_14210 [Gemmatimonadota bacterium]
MDRYDGAGQGIDGTDRGFAAAIDNQGNTIVAGFSAEPLGGSYLAIKYAPDGTRLWVAAENIAGGGVGRTMTVDDADNVIVVGSAEAGSQFGVIKYDADGNRLWTRRYDPGPSVLTTFEGVVTDATGAVYAYGNVWPNISLPWNLIVVKYAADGTQLWDLVYPSSQGRAMAFSDGAVYVAGNKEVASNDEDLLVLKVTSSGAVDWARTYGRTASFANDSAEDMAIDAFGNIVAVGTYSGNPSGVTTDVAVVRLAPDGTLLSDVAYDAPGGTHEWGRDLVLDASGNAVVSAHLADPAGGYDVLTAKLDPTGGEIWSRAYGGFETFTDTPQDMAIDSQGGIYVVGDVVSSELVDEYFTIKYDAAGTLEWEQRYAGATQDPSHGMAVDVSADLRVVVTGYSSNPAASSGDDDVATVCYSQSGAVSAPVGLAGAPSLEVVPAPNPFVGSTVLALSLAESRSVTLEIFDVAGRRVRALAGGRTSAGTHVQGWDGRDDAGLPVVAGIYFVRLSAGDQQRTVKIVKLGAN